jgi:hypothetical protein
MGWGRGGIWGWEVDRDRAEDGDRKIYISDGEN